MSVDLTLRVCALYPDLLNIYADRGNLLFLQKRCEWRGIGFELSASGLGEQMEPRSVNLIYIGGGQDRDQQLCALDMVANKRAGILEAIDRGAALLAVCGGYQLLGREYQLADSTVTGTAVAALTTTAGSDRLVGPVAIQTDLGGPAGGLLAGFENHAGRTELDAVELSLGKVQSGHGNNGRDLTEGYRSGKVVGTYLHGPLLPKNWWFADWLTAQALDIGPQDLPELDDSAERAAHIEACTAAGVKPAL